MKKGFSFVLTLILLFSVFTLATAEQNAVYQLGDKMDDFSATLSDGTAVSLYGLLKEKKAVLINFWASWCNPCRMEFPFMEQAYNEMSDEIGIIALSCETADTDEIVLALKQELGLTTLPMGLDIGLANRFALEGYPTSVLVDRNGVICFIEAGSIPDKNRFLRLFSAFTSEDYAAPVLLPNGIPTAKPTAVQPENEAVEKALQIADERINLEPLTDPSVWPFVAAQDASCMQATNGEEMETASTLTLTVDAQAGEALQYEYALSCPAVLDSLTVWVDGEQARYYGGELDWRSDFVPFPTAGTHTVRFEFQRTTSMTESAGAQLRGVKLLSGEEAAALAAQAAEYPKTLAGVECDIAPIDCEYREVILSELSNATKENQSTVILVPEGELTLRVQIGAEVDPHRAYVADTQTAVLLANLPYDEQGFLYPVKISSMANGNANPYNSFSVSSSATDRENAYAKSFVCFATEADIDEYINMIVQMAASYGVTDYQMTWEYADGSPKQSAAPAAPASQVPDGMAEYRIVVRDQAGEPVTGAMIQLCDEGTCQVAVTDAQGVVTHVAAPYPFEIHLLKAPEGYGADGQTYVMPQEGGELVITLQKQ